jgi:hypothetical protein
MVILGFSAISEGPFCLRGAIKLGVAGAHSGDLASYGLPTVKAAELVVKEINAKGGVLGRQVELLMEDDVCNRSATNTATKLFPKVRVIGHICSGATKAALGIYKDAKLVVISPSATNPELTQSGQYPNFYRTIASDDAHLAQVFERFYYFTYWSKRRDRAIEKLGAETDRISIENPSDDLYQLAIDYIREENQVFGTELSARPLTEVKQEFVAF